MMEVPNMGPGLVVKFQFQPVGLTFTKLGVISDRQLVQARDA